MCKLLLFSPDFRIKDVTNHNHSILRSFWKIKIQRARFFPCLEHCVISRSTLFFRFLGKMCYPTKAHFRVYKKTITLMYFLINLLVFAGNVGHNILIKKFENQGNAVGKNQMLRHKFELVHVIHLIKKIVEKLHHKKKKFVKLKKV